MGLIRSVKVGDEIKSWDVLKTAQFIEKNLSRSAAILDIGAYASEILCILHRRGYSNLTGIDLNPDINHMPYAQKIRYVASDFMHTAFENESFEAITSTSVIEHGFNAPALLAEMSRLLRPGGYFIASFDYWPEKIDTSDTPFFGMDWKIFSKQEVLFFIDEARAYNLAPCGNINLAAEERPVECAERKYTFAWLALQKSRGGSSLKG
jgi:SAM-dependent methyltransferase